MKKANLAASALALAACLAGPALAQQASPPPQAPLPATQQAARPNILVWMLDDVGFAQLACFGGLIATPNIDRVASRGLRYTNYHTPPICSAARAAFLTGRNTHSVHMGAHAATPRNHPGYDAMIPPGAGTIAENLRQAGYATFALGKWDHVPLDHLTQAGPTTYWPLRQGFERFYGFLAAETDNFHPLLWRDNTPVDAPRSGDYHLSRDMADQAVAMIEARGSKDPAPPFFMYWATGVAHAPHHAPADWIARYKGKFDQGWDKAREDILKRQKAQGLVPRHARLSPRPEAMPAWDSLDADQKRMAARQMEVFAAAISHADAEFGRILDSLEARGELDNTIVVVLSDNGASAEGGPGGSYHELLFAMGALPDNATNLRFIDRWGGPGTYPHYAFGWAVAGNTPFRNYKQTTYEGGTRVPLVISWPKGIAARGELRGDFVHTSDLTPTLLEAAGVQPAPVINNAPQMPFEGRDFTYSFTGKVNPQPSRQQYFEMFGHKGLWADGWKIVTLSKPDTWNMLTPGSVDKPWELYNLDRDPGERDNLAAAHPAKLAELDKAFNVQAKRFNVFPIAEQSTFNRELGQAASAEFGRRKGRWFFPDPVARVLRPHSPPFERGAFAMTAEVTLSTGGENGPIFAQGGALGGVGLYLTGGRPNLVIRDNLGQPLVFSATEALPAGTTRLEVSVLAVDPANRASNRRAVTIRAGDRTLLTHEGEFRLAPGLGELFEIGRDDGTVVGEGYAPSTDFPGRIRNVEFLFP